MDITVREVMDAVLKCVRQDTIKCVQQVPGPRYRLTFRSLEYKQLFLDQPFHLRGERVNAQELARHFLIPWTGGAFSPLGAFLCPTTEEKKWPISPKPWSYYLY